MDGATASPQEMANREVLAALARKLSVRFALPRSSMACPTQPGSICWGWSFDDAELAAAASVVRAGARACFGDGPVTLVGFSNGGYLLNKLIRSCSLKSHVPEAVRAITVGAGVFHGPLEPSPESLTGCGELTMLVGDEDEHNFDPSGNLLRQLRAKHANVREVRYHGGHLLNEAALGDALSARRP
ncbi:MAG: hypothetical protein KF837_29400 [Labilithrix sp.]|nr:hypothetical protein [Labilithrix sp.]